jgi:ribosomal protein S8
MKADERETTRKQKQPTNNKELHINKTHEKRKQTKKKRVAREQTSKRKQQIHKLFQIKKNKIREYLKQGNRKTENGLNYIPHAV